MFIHGYNVPYSLALLQSNEMEDLLIQEHGGNNGDIFLIRVIWPSGSYKEKNISNSKCDYSNFSKPITLKLYKYVTNRAYLAGLTLRSMIADIDCEKIKVITHSHGAVIISSALINPFAKIKDTSTTFNRSLVKEFNKIAIPHKSIDIFYECSSYAWGHHFANWDPLNNYNHYFFVGFNMADKILLKKKPFLLNIPLAKSKWLGSTTLGCNYDGEIRNTDEILLSKIPKGEVLLKYFHSNENGCQKEHDFFCYLKTKFI
jgi:hypothetical protein